MRQNIMQIPARLFKQPQTLWNCFNPGTFPRKKAKPLTQRLRPEGGILFL
jgi:hypothetical protein